MTDLSPAAQSVLDFVCDNTEPDCDTQHLIAAALRAAADQVVIKLAGFGQESAWCLKEIADELENHNG
jgi:hypothetical protein